MYVKADNTMLCQGDLLVSPWLELELEPSIIEVEPILVAGEKCASCQTVSKEKKVKTRTFSKPRARLAANAGYFHRSREACALVTVELGVVLTHSCDIDQGGLVTLAIIQPWTSLEPAFQKVVEDPANETQFMVLDECGDMPRAVVNLDKQMTLSLKHFGKKGSFKASSGRFEGCLMPFSEVVQTRVATLNDESMRRLFRLQFQQSLRAKNLSFDFDQNSRMALDALRPKDLPSKGWSWPLPAWVKKEEASGAFAPPTASGSGPVVEAHAADEKQP